jgi:SAM-dependent methyltransferase
MDQQLEKCPLCTSGRTAGYHRDQRREYRHCQDCGLVFVPARYFLSPREEKACYDLHQNNSEDLHYRQFLNRLAQPLLRVLAPGARGLDFGSGPGPTLSLMLTEAGYPTDIFDPYYAPHPAVWSDEYDFVTATEVVEHLHRPLGELQRLWAVLKPGGWLGIMTKRVVNQTAFTKWHYKNDPTHVTFFSEQSFAWLAKHWSAELRLIGADVVLLRKLR